MALPTQEQLLKFEFNFAGSPFVNTTKTTALVNDPSVSFLGRPDPIFVGPATEGETIDTAAFGRFFMLF